MGRRSVPVWAVVGMTLVCGLAVWGCRQTDEPSTPAVTTGSESEELVVLEVPLPKEITMGTPIELDDAPTREKYSKKPRPAFHVPKGTSNLALKKKVTSSDPAPVVGELKMVTDGDKEGLGGSFVELAPERQWVQIDLEKPADLYAVVVWHFHSEFRIYHGVIVQVSDDPKFAKDVKTIFNNDFDNSCKLGAGKNLEYIEDYRGKLIDAKDA